MSESSVADPECFSRTGSRILFFPIPDSRSRIPDRKTALENWGEKKLVVIPFFAAINFTKLKLFYFWNAEEKNLGQFSKNYRTFYPKNCHYVTKIWVWDQGSKRHRIPDPDRQHCQKAASSTINSLKINRKVIRIQNILKCLRHKSLTMCWEHLCRGGYFLLPNRE